MQQFYAVKQVPGYAGSGMARNHFFNVNRPCAEPLPVYIIAITMLREYK